MTKRTSRKTTSCRACESKKLLRVLKFGSTPLANSFLKKSTSGKKEKLFPLNVVFCQTCSLLQLEDIVNPKLMFADYVYVSSTSKANVAHFTKLAYKVTKKLKFQKGSLVIDIGSNDGVLLKPFMKQGMKVLGIEPAKNIAKRANKEGVPTIAKFFTPKLAKQILVKNGKAQVITATNVFAHVDDLDEMVEGVKILLKESGSFVIEAPYLVDFLEKNLFDTVYHEHLSYLSVRPLRTLFSRLGMKVFAVSRNPSHGGSIRVYVKKNKGAQPVESSVYRLSRLEKNLHLNQVEPYKQFAKRVAKNKLALRKMLDSIKSEDKTIVGYGAPAKGNTLLNYFKIGKDDLDYIVDDSVYKQGLFTPGTHIPVVDPQRLYQDKPDYVLILAWNFAESIIKRHRKYKKIGGKFIIPVPEPRVI